MSMTARERHNPPPRRKSCAACIKSKRRCDFAVPACLRCSQRKIPCTYPNRSSRSQPPTPQAEADVMQDPLSETPVPLVTQLDSSPEDFNAVITAVDTELQDFTEFELPLNDEMLELIHQPSMLAPPSSKDFEALSDVIASRLQWSVDQIQKAPISMILETQTPWCHPMLWKNDMPHSMQDAHAACALYLAKNLINTPIIFRSIEAKVQGLLASPLPLSARDSLAHTQALLLYQIIRLFDGNITARAAAERTMSALESSSIALLAHTNFDIASPPSLPLFPLNPTKTFWHDWIFQESARRTLLFTFYFMQTYRILSGQKGLTCDGRLGLCHSWTFSARLWGAESAVAFAELWGGKRHFVVHNATFGDVLEKAEAGDVDLFGKIFISSFLGVEEAEGWFASKGGKL